MEDKLNMKGVANGIPVFCVYDKIVNTAELKPNPNNPNQHPQDQIELLAEIIRAQGWRQSVKVSTRSGLIVSGHGRYEAAILLGCPVPVDYQEYASETDEMADLLADNRIAELADMDAQKLAAIFAEAEEADILKSLSGYDDDTLSDLLQGLPNAESEAVEERFEEVITPLKERFIVPPFSILDTRQGYWQDRKNAWIRLGINSEVGRKSGLIFSCMTQADPSFYTKKRKKEKELGRKLDTREYIDNYYDPKEHDFSTSMFDPVLCELSYRWFCPEGGKILDPFAGGSVRGIVASVCGYDYTGIDLRGEQIEANQEQWTKIEEMYRAKGNRVPAPQWIVGDSSQMLHDMPDNQYDMVFSCPPYADLEVYSDDPKDLSNMSYGDFMKALEDIIRQAVSKLKDDRFAAFVVSEIRDKNGNYRGFVQDTIGAFEKAGMKYYNEFILINQAGGLVLRLARQFNSSRKAGRNHQNVLVFLKGDMKKTVAACGKISTEFPEGDWE